LLRYARNEAISIETKGLRFWESDVISEKRYIIRIAGLHTEIDCLAGRHCFQGESHE